MLFRSTAEAGLKVLSTAPADAVIVDMRLAGMDGNSFIEMAHDIRPQAHFFIYTGSVGYQPPPSLRAIGIGEEQVFQKPLRDMSLLVKAMRQRMDARRKE